MRFFDPYTQIKSDLLHDWLLGLFRYLIEGIKRVFLQQTDAFGTTWWSELHECFTTLFAYVKGHPVRNLCKGLDFFSTFDGEAYQALVYFLPFAVLTYNHSRVEPVHDVLLGIAILARIVLDRMQIREYTQDFVADTASFQRRCDPANCC